MKQNLLMYAIIGDMCGSVYEYLAMKRIKPTVEGVQNLMQDGCKFTDDTVHTLAVAQAILENPINPDFERFIKSFTKLYPNRGYGPRLMRWAHNQEKGDSWGNGAYMRLLPVLLAYSWDKVWGMAIKSISCSHNNPLTYNVLPSIIYWKTGEDIDVSSWSDKQVELFEDGNFEEYAKTYGFYSSTMDSVPECLAVANYAESYEDCIKKAILLGGDTDTQACIAGYLYGIKEEAEIPQDLYDWAWSKLPEEFKDILNRFQEFIDAND